MLDVFSCTIWCRFSLLIFNEILVCRKVLLLSILFKRKYNFLFEFYSADTRKDYAKLLRNFYILNILFVIYNTMIKVLKGYPYKRLNKKVFISFNIMFLCIYIFVSFFGKSYKTSKQNQSEELTMVNPDQTIFSKNGVWSVININF